MSGFLPDLANWALRGGAAAAEEQQGQQEAAESVGLPPVPITAEELRTQRLARMQQQQRQQNEPQPMEIDLVPPAEKTIALVKDSSAKKAAMTKEDAPVLTQSLPSAAAKRTVKKAKNEDLSPNELSKRLQRKKEVLLQKCLCVQLVGSNLIRSADSNNSNNGAAAPVLLDTGSTEISVSTVAEILASRLTLEPAVSPPSSSPLVIAYLGASYNRTVEELKSLHSAKKSQPSELVELLQEIQRQTVSYAATCLMEPDLFPDMAKDATIQLAMCLLRSTTATGTPETNLTLGATNSFYYQVIEELQQQNAQSVQEIVGGMVKYFCTLLSSSDSVLDASSTVNDGTGVDPISSSPTAVVTTLTTICSHKRAGMAITDMDILMLPPAGTPEAAVIVRPSLPITGANPLQQLLANADAHRPYAARSGPALEKATILGLCLRTGVPKHNNPAFPAYSSILRQSVQVVESTMRSQRHQLAAHQQACYQFLMALLKSGPTARSMLLQWFTDALLVNLGAAALRPDQAKVSSSSLMLNTSIMLLKLCDPFVGDDAKQHLIDAGFVSSVSAHGGVFATTGDEAVPRLGSSDGDSANQEQATYNPKNAFIPQCFFFCARSLHLGVVPGLQQHENLLRNISHWHYEITNAGGDIHADPRFPTLISRQRSEEVALFQEEMIESTLRFCNFMAKVLYDMDDATVSTMPEEFVSDICDVLLAMATLKPKLLAGHEFRHVFKLVVKLLAPKYANVRCASKLKIDGIIRN